MTTTEATSTRERCHKGVRHLSLLALSIGMEGGAAVVVILMIANIQTLGVPMAYAALPSSVGTLTGVFLIPFLGFILVRRRGEAKWTIAKIIIATTSVELMGTFCVFLGNTLRFMSEDEITKTYTTSSLPPSLHTLQTVKHILMADNTITTETNSPVTPKLNANIYPTMPFSWWENSHATTKLVELVNLTHASNLSRSDSKGSEGSLPLYAALGMIGYLMTGLGYDCTCCFLKVFAVDSTPPADHASVLVKFVVVSSVGGCLIAVLGSLKLGDDLTAGTQHDSNAAQCALLAALCFLLILPGLIITLTTRFYCPPHSGHDEEPLCATVTVDENSQLVSSGPVSNDPTPPQKPTSQSCLESRLETTPVSENGGAASVHNNSLTVDDKSPKNRLCGFLIRRKKQILINISMFFFYGALYSFETFIVNFLGQAIFKGDPTADVDSDEYKRYLDGIQTGSTGTLIYYVSYLVVNLCQEFLLDKLGWKLEIILVPGIYVVLNLVCALTASLWSYYLATVWTGVLRTVIASVPYILADRLARQSGEDKDSGVAIACVGAMIPLGFSVCTGLMGPLIYLTGNPATSVYFTATSCFLGTVTISFLKVQ